MMIIIDLGCGFAPHHSKFPESIGLDLRRGFADIIGDVENTPFRGSIADIAVMANIIEHVNSINVIREAHRILKPKGKLKIVTPNPLSLGRIISSLLFGRYNPHSLDHIQAFGSAELSNLLEKAGFKTYSIKAIPIYFQKGIRSTFEAKVRSYVFIFLSYLLPEFSNMIIAEAIKS